MTRSLRLALAFLTIVPVPVADGEVSPSSLVRARFAYPLAGGVIGLFLAGLSEALRRAGLAPGPSAFLLVAALAWISGGLHLDGLADSADGLFLRGDPARRLAVMKDPHVGSFGVAAMVLVLLGKFASLEALAGPGRSWAILGASTVARSLVLVSAGLAPYARPDGTGRFLVDAARPRDAILGMVVAVSAGWGIGGLAGVVASMVGLGVALWLTRVARRNLGGVTGDTLGALVELGELAFLLAMGLPLAP